MIPRIHKPSPQQLEAAARRKQPFVVTGLINDWDIMDWTPDELAEKHPNYPCRIALTLVEQMSATRFISIPLKKYVEILKNMVLDPASEKNFYFLENRGFLPHTGLEKVLEDEIEDCIPVWPRAIPVMP
jgi:hypothetical protein